MEEEYKLGDTIQEFEELFGNVPFEDIEKIKKWLFNNFIPISVIQNKIDELEHEKFKRTQLGVFLLKNFENQRLLAQLQVLQELLQESEK